MKKLIVTFGFRTWGGTSQVLERYTSCTKMKLIKLLSILVLFSVNLNFLSSQEKVKLHKIDIELEACLSQDSNYTTLGMRNCTNDALNKWDIELNKTYNLLLKKLNNEEKKALKSSQRNWLMYYKLEGNFISLYFSNFLGTMWPLISERTYLELIRQRTLMLQTYLDYLEYK